VRNVALVVLALLAGCGRPAHVTVHPSPPPGPTESFSPLPPVPPPDSSTPTGPPSPTGFAEEVAVPCAGRPDAAQILALLRAQLPPAGGRATVSTGPLCAGTWQYSVVTQSGHEPLQVVTRSGAGTLTLVTAGTDVCTVEVRSAAPPGILAAANC